MSFIEGKASKKKIAKKCSFGGGGMQLDDYTNVDLIAFLQLRADDFTADDFTAYDFTAYNFTAYDFTAYDFTA